MGAWGLGNFENDTALDWIADFEAQPTLEYIEETINQVFTEEYLDADQSSVVLAAIEIVAAIRNKPSNDFPELDPSLIGNLQTSLSESLVEKSLMAIERILQPEENELYALWEETNEFNNWIALEEDLVKRLY